MGTVPQSAKADFALLLAPEFIPGAMVRHGDPQLAADADSEVGDVQVGGIGKLPGCHRRRHTVDILGDIAASFQFQRTVLEKAGLRHRHIYKLVQAAEFVGLP